MLISYMPTELIHSNPVYQNVTGSEAPIKISKPIYKVDDVAYDKVTLRVWSKVTGDIASFQSSNFGKYRAENSVKQSGDIEYFVKPEYSNPITDDDIYKLRARAIINSEVGDIYDLLTDVSKRLVMTERLVVFLSTELLNSGHIPLTQARYSNMLQGYNQLLAMTNGVMDVSDLHDPMDLFMRLSAKGRKITSIVNDEYLSKKV